MVCDSGAWFLKVIHSKENTFLRDNATEAIMEEVMVGRIWRVKKENIGQEKVGEK